ncbi:hypothetical protein AB0P21_40865 [Kribbella sp. NPDC056861]|uniref:hypothetical protein n=1 Tax=Kribbella sp. NPDC056861 TaxID=3154857 RepID=UPI00344A0EA1
MSRLVAAAGALLFATGLVLGFRAISVPEHGCGSVFKPSMELIPMACDSRLDDRRGLVTGLGAAGLLATVGGLGSAMVQDRRSERNNPQYGSRTASQQ